MTNDRQSDNNSPNLPITYHVALAGRFEGWASEYGCPVAMLRTVGETAIRMWHHKANIELPSPDSNGGQPDVYSLKLGLPSDLRVYYSIECHAVMIRGYGWEIFGGQQGDYDVGGYYAETSWILPQKI